MKKNSKPATITEDTVAPASDKPTKDKTKCPVTREQFMSKAPVLTMTLSEGDKVIATFIAPPREFSTKSLGWNFNDKVQAFAIDGKVCKLQVGSNFTVVGSKELPK